MRCNNCGWNNPDGLDKCQKCNQPLQEIRIADNEDRTIRKSLKNESGVSNCPSCGYPCAENSEICPNCGKQLVIENSKRNSKDRKEPLSNESDSKSRQTAKVKSGKMTVADISEIVDLDKIEKKTVIIDSKEKKGLEEPNNAFENTYDFECMDKPDHPSVRIITGMSLDIVKDDIILIGGLRFIKI